MSRVGDDRRNGHMRSRIEASRTRQSTLSGIAHHTCTCTSVSFITVTNAYQTVQYGEVTIDLTAFRLTPHSLLCRVLQQLPCPFNYSKATVTRRILEAAKQSQELAEIFSKPIHAVLHADIVRLYELIEDEVERTPPASRYTISLHGRSIFKETLATFSDGTLISFIRFKSRFKSPHHQKAPRESFSPALSDEEKIKIHEDYFLEGFNTLDERNAKYGEKLDLSAATILGICEKSFSEHAQLIELLSSASQHGRPILPPRTKIHADGSISRAQFLRLTEFEQLALSVHLVNENKLHTNFHGGLYLSYISLLAKRLQRPTQFAIHQLLLANFYLPRITLIACLIALLIETAWNIQTVLSLTTENVTPQGEKYLLVGVKKRTDSAQDVEIFDATHTQNVAASDTPDEDTTSKLMSGTAATAIKLLLASAKAIEQNFGLQDIPLFFCFIGGVMGKYAFSLPHFPENLNDFFEQFRLQKFPLMKLRELGAHRDFLGIGGNLFTSQAVLNHSSGSTTERYLNTTLIIKLLEANNRRFMDKLAATIIVKLGRTSKLEDEGLQQSDVQPLLFPASEYSDEPCLADEWTRLRDRKFQVGVNEAIHVAIQYTYYSENFEKLAADNPLRFTEIHLPRLIFCGLIRQHLLNGPHAGLYRQIEKDHK